MPSATEQEPDGSDDSEKTLTIEERGSSLARNVLFPTNVVFFIIHSSGRDLG